MSDKLLQVYEQYNMEILSTRKGRGATILETNVGMRILEPFRGNYTRLEQTYILKKMLFEHGYENIDYIIKNEENQILSYDKYRQPFLLKCHFDGTECDMRNEEDLIRSILLLARFHLKGQQLADAFDLKWQEHLAQMEENRMQEIRDAIENGDELEKLASLYEISEEALQKVLNNENVEQFIASQNESVKGNTEKNDRSIETIFTRHNRELKKIERFIRTVKRKNTFEKLYLSVCEDFYKKGEACLEMGTGHLNLDAHYGICHGNYNQHNIILGEGFEAIVHFEKFFKGNQLQDLYQFLRKVMEKNHFDFALLELLLATYASVIDLSKDDYQYMFLLFSYPEKFYKIGNSYYNTNKVFLSPKYVEKLETVIAQEEEKQELLQRFGNKNNFSIT